MNPVTLPPPSAPAALPVPIGTPPAAAPPAPHRWTLAEYQALAATGLFHDRKTLLLDGVLYVMPLPGPAHDLALGLVDDWLRTVFAVGYHVRVQMAFHVGTDSDVGPDLAVIAGTRRDLAGRTPTTAVLVVEVADTSLGLHTTTKAELYATAGVPEYWVLDVVGRELHVFRDPQPLPRGLGATAYRSHQTLSAGERVSPRAAPQAVVTVADLLP